MPGDIYRTVFPLAACCSLFEFTVYNFTQTYINSIVTVYCWLLMVVNPTFQAIILLIEAPTLELTAVNIIGSCSTLAYTFIVTGFHLKCI